MIDVAATNSLTVMPDEVAGPYLIVPLDELDSVRGKLRVHSVPYTIDEDAIAIDEGPYTVVVHFQRGADVSAVQALLDTAG